MIYSKDTHGILNGIEIKVVHTDDNEWNALYVEGSCEYEGEEIPHSVWLQVLRYYGADVRDVEIERCETCFEPTEVTFNGMCEECYDEMNGFDE